MERRTPEERVEAAIDLAVREMLDLEPRADLRARVIEEIERPRSTFKWTWVALPVAVAAVLLLAVVLWQPSEPIVTRAVTQIVVRPTDTRLPPLLTRGNLPRTHSDAGTLKPERRRVTAAVAAADDTNFSIAAPADFAIVDALAPPPPIAVEEIRSGNAAAVARLDVAPLQLPALELNALPDSPRERREE